jgi:hypothetical protein
VKNTKYKKGNWLMFFQKTKKEELTPEAISEKRQQIVDASSSLAVDDDLDKIVLAEADRVSGRGRSWSNPENLDSELDDRFIKRLAEKRESKSENKAFTIYTALCNLKQILSDIAAKEKAIQNYKPIDDTQCSPNRKKLIAQLPKETKENLQKELEALKKQKAQAIQTLKLALKLPRGWGLFTADSYIRTRSEIRKLQGKEPVSSNFFSRNAAYLGKKFAEARNYVFGAPTAARQQHQ